MRVERVIAVPAGDAVGPTRLRLLTAGSAKLPVVVVAEFEGAPAYHIFDVAGLLAGLRNELSATRVQEALELTGAGPAPVSRGDVAAVAAGRPVVDNGRLIGVTADDAPEYPEPSEQDMARGGKSGQDPEPGRKRGLWQRLSRSNDQSQ